MATTRNAIVLRDDFARAQTLTTTPTGEFGWTEKEVKTNGTPTYLCVSNDAGAISLTLDNTNEAQSVCMFQNDILPFRLDQLLYVEFNIQVSGIGSATTLVYGVGSAQNATPDSVAYNYWFRMEGSASTSAIVVETDDGTTDTDDKATGQTLSNSYKRCTIDFSYGLTDVRFYINGARVASSTTFSANATPSQRVQLYAQVQKTASTNAPAVTIDYVEIAHRLAG